ncbi:MAG: hypothetical protein AAF621_01070 [Pseudomonadota bacterium]
MRKPLLYVTLAGGLLFPVFYILQVPVGFFGIEHHFGALIAIASVCIALYFRTMLPFLCGAFFGVTDVLGWHWLFAILFILPGTLSFLSSLRFFRKLGRYGINHILEKRRQRYSNNGFSESWSAKDAKGEIIEAEYEVVDDKKDRNY